VIPDGWKLVPIKPTVEIVKAGGKARVDDFNRNSTTLSPKDANRVAEAMYRAMIEAAPATDLENGDGRDALESALRQIADQEHIELMLDPTWAQRIAIAALSRKTGEKDD